MSDTTPGETPSSNSATTLPKAYDPSSIEQRWAEYWIANHLFNVPTPQPGQPRAPGLEPETRKSDPFTILLPPPNVTGRLHMGHMLNQTEMDILIRWHRMNGRLALWVPGTDHAGIATQMMVERQLAAEGSSRKALGREAFAARVWAWKQQYGSAITDQMKRLGASVAWFREYFTMDDRLSLAVKEAFVRLYAQGLIYRASYVVNWDPVQQTAVSDLEVESEERVGKLYSIRYPFAGAVGPFDHTNSIVIATTRPETMLGDTAVAVNPNDPRYRHLIGVKLQLPLTRREIPIIADDWAKPEFGTGAVKVTPAHDPNDFAIGQRHPEIGSLTILNETAHIQVPGGSSFDGLDRYDAREKIVGELQKIERLVEVKDHPMTVPISQRSGAVIEPRLSMQWFLAVNKEFTPSPNCHPERSGVPGERSLLAGVGSEGPASPGAPRKSIARPSIAQTAINAVRNGHIRFTPEMYAKTYFEWMTNIHDWCISRQLWWGHRIPAWHCAACAAITVARETPTACATCGATTITQETDVLDTWFSSGLLPFTVFGWPSGTNDLNCHPDPEHREGEGPAFSHKSGLTPDLAAFYPTSLLLTGFDILFFWVARMIMLSCHFMLNVPTLDPPGHLRPRTLAEAVPFKAVYIHGLVRDANREKMSKTKGNVLDPIEIITKYGTDAVRFTLASMASPGTDIAFSEARTEGYRAFANKIWNAARFLFMNLDRARESGIEITLPSATTPGAPSIAPSAMGGLSSGARPTSHDQPPLTLESRWVLTRLSLTVAAVNNSLNEYRFDEAANHIYQFFWGDFCDWYLELVKLRLNFDLNPQPEPSPKTAILSDPSNLQPEPSKEIVILSEPPNLQPEPSKETVILSERSESKDLRLSEDYAATQAALTTLVAVFEATLRLLSPFMPFLTEEIWHALYAGNPPAKSIALTRYPQPADYPVDGQSVSGMNLLQGLITTIRAQRKELGVPEKESVGIFNVFSNQVLVGSTDKAIGNVVLENKDILFKLAKVSAMETKDIDYLSKTRELGWTFAGEAGEVAVLYERTIDIPAERERLTKDLAKYEKTLAASEARLADPNFTEKAPAPIVEGLRKQTAETRTLYEKTKAALEALVPEH